MQDLKLKINEFAKKLIDLNEGDYNLHFFVGYLKFEFPVNGKYW